QSFRFFDSTSRLWIFRQGQGAKEECGDVAAPRRTSDDAGNAEIAKKPQLLTPPLHLYRDIVAERLLRHVIPVNRIGPRPAAAADVDELALPAFSLVGLEVAQFLEYLGILPYLPERRGLDVAGGAVEIGAGLDIAEAVDEADGLGRYAPLAAAGGEGKGAALELETLGLCLLRHDPVVVGSTGGAHQDIVLVLLLLVMPVEDLLVILLGDQFTHDLLAATGRDDHEHVPGSGAEGLGDLEGGCDV